MSVAVGKSTKSVWGARSCECVCVVRRDEGGWVSHLCVISVVKDARSWGEMVAVKLEPKLREVEN